jgi:uncharacterized protein (DUF1697 family)
MPTYVALLRGINVGRNNRIAMADLREVLGSLGHERIRTHILSGNAIFSSGRRGVPGLESELERALSDRFKLDVRVLIRTAAELAAIVDRNPLPAAASDGSRFFVLFLDRNPDEERLHAIDPTDFAPDEFRVGDRVIYAWYKHGLTRSKLAGALSDKRLGVTTTARNWNTVTRLVELANDVRAGG